MKHTYNSKFHCIMVEPDCAIEELAMMLDVSTDYDGCGNSIEGLRKLVDEWCEVARRTMAFINEGRLFTDEALEEDTYWAAKADYEAHAAEWKVGKQNEM